MEALELPPGEKALISLQLPAEFIIVFDPVTHATQFIDVKGEPTKERQSLTIVFNDVQAPTGTRGDAAGSAAAVAGEPHPSPCSAERLDRQAMRCMTCWASASRSSRRSGC